MQKYLKAKNLETKREFRKNLKFSVVPSSKENTYWPRSTQSCILPFTHTHLYILYKSSILILQYLS